MSDDRVCHQLTSLPTKHTFSGDRILLVDNLSENDIPALYSAARGRCEDASESRQPFGEDEFLDEDSFRDFLEHSYVVVLRDAEQTDAPTYGFISAAGIQRTDKPTFADLRVATFTTSVARDRRFHEEMVELLLKLSAEAGYAGCMQTIFSSDAMALQAATSSGFLPVLYAPQNGNVAGRRCDSVMFFKWLSEDARKNMALDKDREMPGKRLFPAYTERPLLTYLPKTRTLANGREVRVRYMEETDVPGVLAMWEDAIERGAGYAIGELPPIEMMYAAIQADGNLGSFVFETLPECKLVGAMNVNPQCFCRTATPAVADVFLMVEPAFCGQGLATEMTKLYFRFASDMGFSACATDVFANNAAMRNILQKQGMHVIGCVPLSGFVKNTGCLDSYMYYKDISAETLVEL